MKSLFVLVAVVASVALSPFVAQSEEAETAKTEVSKEAREKMAQAHEKMATCLRSAKPIDECREEMRTACADQGPGCGLGFGPMHGGKRGYRK